MKTPGRLTTVVDAEALFNDGTGVVLFTIALVAVTQPVGLAEGAIQFAVIVVVSGVLGLVAGAAGARLIALVDARVVQMTISVVVAYGTYLAALRLGQSGIVATVSAGIVIGWAGQRGIISNATMAALDDLWSVAAFVLTAVTFLLSASPSVRTWWCGQCRRSWRATSQSRSRGPSLSTS